MINEKEFNIVQLKVQQIIDRYELDQVKPYLDWNSGGIVIEIAKSFAVGDRITANRDERSHVETRAHVPATAWDWVKRLITDWQPTLYFGWLIPHLNPVETKVSVTVNETIYNVYPVQPQGELRRIAFADISYPSPLQWLSSVPPTQEQIYQAEIELLNATDSARFMAYNRLFGNRQ